MSSTVIVLAGANGAGKSTLYATRVAPNFNGPFINADLIQSDELGDASPDAAYEAARIAADRRQRRGPDMRVAYTRLSSAEQNTDRQSLTDVERTFEDKFSGGTTDRPALQEMLSLVRDGDVVVVWSIDRLARSLKDLQNLIAQMNAKGVSVEFASERLTSSANTDDPFARLQFQIMGAFAEFERAIIRKRQDEGIQKAKSNGVYKGRRRSKPLNWNTNVS